jgi:hypothetical protein
MAALGGIDFDKKKWQDIRKSLNFLSQYNNWDEIIQEAVWAWASEIEDTAQFFLNQKVENQTNRLKNSIYVVVDEYGDLAIKSKHRAARLIDKGGFSPFPDWRKGQKKSESIREYAEYYGMEPFLLARAIYKNQPFAEATNFAWNAAYHHKDDIKDEIYAIAKRRKDEA